MSLGNLPPGTQRTGKMPSLSGLSFPTCRCGNRRSLLESWTVGLQWDLGLKVHFSLRVLGEGCSSVTHPPLMGFQAQRQALCALKMPCVPSCFPLILPPCGVPSRTPLKPPPPSPLLPAQVTLSYGVFEGKLNVIKLQGPFSPEEDPSRWVRGLKL